MNVVAKFLTAIVAFFLVVVLVSVLIAVPIMLLLNWLIAPTALIAVFGVAKIGFWKALGIGLLCGTLFKSSVTSTKN